MSMWGWIAVFYIALQLPLGVGLGLAIAKLGGSK